MPTWGEILRERETAFRQTGPHSRQHRAGGSGVRAHQDCGYAAGLEAKEFMTTDTNCRKCKAPMAPLPPSRGTSPFDMAKMTITAYLCDKCGHWNGLKRRKSKPPPAPALSRKEGEDL